MKLLFQSVNISSPKIITNESIYQATVIASCTFVQFQVVFTFKKNGSISKPTLACRNYSARTFHACGPLCSSDLVRPCPIITERIGDIEVYLMSYLLKNGFINEAECKIVNPKLYELVKISSQI